MRKTALLLLLSFSTVGAAWATHLTLTDSGAEGCVPLPPDPRACWSEPGDLYAAAYSSMYIDMGLGEIVDSEVANDFLFDEGAEIVWVRWWAGVW